MANKNFVRSSALFCALLLASTGCGRIAASARHDDSPPPNVKGDPMEPVTMTRQQEQDKVYEYYQKTLHELPEGYSFDNSNLGSLGIVVNSCTEYGSVKDPNNPAKFTDARFVVASFGTNNIDLVKKIGDIWKGWGWRVEEREGFNKPNRFGISPDGYTIKAEVANGDPLRFQVQLMGSSPCFLGDSNRDEFIPFAAVVTRDGPQYRN